MFKEKNKRVRYAVIGAGNIAQVAVLPAFRNAAENSELVALVSGESEKRAGLAKRHHIPFTGHYDELERVIEEAHVQAVYITVPNSLHRAFTERAARLGVHVLCEKPLAGTIEDCEAMIRVCAEHDVRLMTAYRLHFEKANLSAIEEVVRGAIGEPRLFSSVFSQQVRAGDVRTKRHLAGGALFDVGVYCINAARYIFRDEPEEVVALSASGGDPRFGDGVDEATTAILRFPGGRLAQMTASLGAASSSSYRVVGSRGELRVEPAYDYSQPLKHYLTVDGKTREKTFSLRDQFGPELVHFSRSVLERSQPGPSGEEGLFDVRIGSAIRKAVMEKRAVSLLPFVPPHRPDLRQLITKPAVRSKSPIDAPPPARS
jgi:predicted dehydrogenase